MYIDYVKKIKNEKIFLSLLQNIDVNNEKEENIIKEEIQKIKRQSLKLYYKIDENKIKKLELTFLKSKLKVYISSPENIGNNILKDKCIIYDNKYFSKLYEIKFEYSNIYKCQLIELDNTYIIIFFIIEDLNDK